jgi:fructosamine-3-kinase
VRLNERLTGLTGRDVRSVRPVGGQHGYRHLEVDFADGRLGFAKVAEDAEDAAPDTGSGALAAEANGLRWLGQAGAVPVPDVLGVDDKALVISLVPAGGQPDARAAFGFGADLARMHAHGADSFGAPWPGYIAGLPLDNTPLDQAAFDRTTLDNNLSWSQWYAERRLASFLPTAMSSGALRAQEAALVEAVIERLTAMTGDQEPPSRIHGDCWSGNVLWSGGRGWLIDPAAHGGHRETDLAMLALFGAPRLDVIVAGYESVAPLAPGWQSRVPLHQLHPLLVHACLFGASYRSAVAESARAALENC